MGDVRFVHSVTHEDAQHGDVRGLRPSERPDEYWVDDVVDGVIASDKGIIGDDNLYSRIEAQYAGKGRPRGLASL